MNKREVVYPPLFLLLTFNFGGTLMSIMCRNFIHLSTPHFSQIQNPIFVQFAQFPKFLSASQPKTIPIWLNTAQSSGPRAPMRGRTSLKDHHMQISRLI
jgi:hypothetical protein